MKITITRYSISKKENENDKQYVLYHITVNYDGVIWEIARRYSEFEKLYIALSKVINTKKFGKFPKKEVLEFFEVNKHWEEIKNFAALASTSSSSNIAPPVVYNIDNNNNLKITIDHNLEHLVYNVIDSPTVAYQETDFDEAPPVVVGQPSRQSVESRPSTEKSESSLQEFNTQSLFVAIRDHNPKDETELSFKAGDVIEVIQRGSCSCSEQDCYWYGRNTSETGSQQGFFDARCLDLGTFKPKAFSVLMTDAYNSDESIQIDGTIKVIEIDYEAEREDEISVRRGQTVKILPTSRQTRKGWKLVEILSESCQRVSETGFIPTEYLMIL
ncbi:predicted protein [Naegleria gruberi]|uniref:Predicted protein n=1 Tax=Naegleria gruberi TaxID=5762 RepID=D2VFI2_NAEGR|nr:uncharacterized protein NAEGRDRAFT_49116 [Naegleria gruberi]EFC44368.1 predicted protein [Naegleria gruberi]|eukprot:XP_002677112.1 predicted protein [Naegleria gruberi strain NEG-M]